MPDTPAPTPAAFSLKLRLVTPWGLPLASKPFRLRWADSLFPSPPAAPWQTDAQGALEVLLPAPAPAPGTSFAGAILFVDPTVDPEPVLWTIPLQVAEHASPNGHAADHASSPAPDHASPNSHAPPDAPRPDPYEAAFRLWNLADLPLAAPPTRASLWHDPTPLLRAIARFSYRHALPLHPDAPTGPLAALPTLESVHDHRAPLFPGRIPRQTR